MKSILYVGATLMIGASIYGFVDYQKTSRNKAFTNMYQEKKVQDPAVVNSKQLTLPVVNKEIAVAEKTDPVTGISSSSTNNTGQTVKKTKKRKFSTRLFSRGALDERFLDKPAKPVEIKIDEKKPDQ